MTQDTFKNYINKRVKIILSNGMFFNGLVLTVGDEYIKIRDINEKEVLIVIANICSMEEMR